MLHPKMNYFVQVYMSNIKETASEYLSGHNYEQFCEMIDRIGKPKSANDPPRVYLWYGTGANGKSTLLNKLSELYTVNYVSALSSGYDPGCELLAWHEYHDDINTIQLVRTYISNDAMYQYDSGNAYGTKLPDLPERADIIIVTNHLDIHPYLREFVHIINFVRRFTHAEAAHEAS